MNEIDDWLDHFTTHLAVNTPPIPRIWHYEGTIVEHVQINIAETIEQQMEDKYERDY